MAAIEPEGVLKPVETFAGAPIVIHSISRAGWQ
jgi:hypothetical protein